MRYPVALRMAFFGVTVADGVVRRCLVWPLVALSIRILTTSEYHLGIICYKFALHVHAVFEVSVPL